MDVSRKYSGPAPRNSRAAYTPRIRHEAHDYQAHVELTASEHCSPEKRTEARGRLISDLLVSALPLLQKSK
ncbi:hypothetical protein GBA52_027963 [Prunus armeniaca]|nr:hypothetical protein GBA52_027963 [Prunus armeniaca]